MLFTPLTQKALEKAAILHDGQYRKGNKHLPFITHPVTVASIVSEHTGDEQVVAAALLHDTLEDTSYTEAQMRADFGDAVTDIVVGVTAPHIPRDTDNPWRSSSEGYLATLQAASQSSAMVAAADKIHNFLSTLKDYRSDRTRFLKDFGGTPDERIEAYGRVIGAIQEKIAPSPLFDELHKTWLEYKAFVESTQHI